MLAVSGNISIQNSNVVIESLDELGHFLTTSANSASSESVTFARGDFSDVHAVSMKDIKDSHSIKDKSQIKDVANMSDTAVLGTDMSVREQRILAILRSGGEVGIRDISSNLPEYSEKMIQRDLVRLVTIGRVKKTGLKRWSRYSIAQ